MAEIRATIPRNSGFAELTTMSRTSTAAAADYGPHEAAMQTYLRKGEARAMALGNRGPIRLDAGHLT